MTNILDTRPTGAGPITDHVRWSQDLERHRGMASIL